MPTIWWVGSVPGRSPALLAATEQQRLDPPHPLPVDEQRADALGSVELVGGERQQVDLQRPDVDGQAPGALGRVHVQQHAALPAEAADGAPRPVTTPVSLFACMSDTRTVSGSSAASTAAGAMRPSAPGFSQVTRQPSPARCRQLSSTALCSVSAVTRCRPRDFRKRAAPMMARLSASVAPDVKITSSGIRAE